VTVVSDLANRCSRLGCLERTVGIDVQLASKIQSFGAVFGGSTNRKGNRIIKT